MGSKIIQFRKQKKKKKKEITKFFSRDFKALT